MTIPTAPEITQEEARAMLEALKEIQARANGQQDSYDRNGPAWTGKDGHEYEDTSAHLAFAAEIGELADAVITITEGRKP